MIIVWPWDFQDSKADVKHRYTKTQAMYLSRKQVLPEVVDMFGMNSRVDDDDIGDDLFGSSDAPEEAEIADEDDVDDMFGSDDDDDVDDMFGSDDDDDVDDMFGSDDDSEAVVEEQPVVEEMPEPEPLADDDDDDDDIDALFA